MNQRKTLEVPEKWFQACDFFPEGKFTLQELKDFVEAIGLEEQKESEEYLYELQLYGYDGGFEIVRYQVRPENDQEYSDRIHQEQQAAKKAKAKQDREYQTYLKLKEKFEQENHHE